HFIETHLDRLHEEIRLAGRVDGEFAPHQFDELLLGRRTPVEFAPLASRLELDVGVTKVWTHWVNGDFRRAEQAENALDFWKFFQQQFLGLLLQVSGSAQPGAAAADEMEEHCALVQLGNELSSQPREYPQRRREQHQRRAHDQPAETKCKRE